MQRRTRLLCVLAAVFLVLGAAALFVQHAQADDGVVGYVGPEACGKCHTEQAQAWTDAPHANATKQQAFVQAWQTAKAPGYCLGCHTTGYDPNTGKYAFEGVTCESCHGPLVQGHPQTPMKVDASPEMCGQCHVSTFNEWKVSKHGQKGIGCVSCHDAHGTANKVGTATELCGKCHVDLTQNFAHAPSSEKGLTCAECHIGPRGGDPADGHAETGHTFQVGTATCSRCHAEEIHQGVQKMMGGGTPTPAVTPLPDEPGAGPPATSGASGVALPILASGTAGLIIGLIYMRLRARK